MGEYDIFVSDLSENGSFEPVFNIGYPVNTTNNNTYFVPIKNGETGIYTMRHEEGIGKRDIWYIEIIPREATVAKALTRLSEQNFSITLTDPDSGEIITLKYDAINDQITVESKSGKDYNVVYSREEND